MPGLEYPDDWDGSSYCTMSIQIPDSIKWRGTVRGALRYLTSPGVWDTDIQSELDEAVAESVRLEKSAMVGCGPTVDVRIDFGFLVSQNGNTYVVDPKVSSGKYVIQIDVNHDGTDWVDDSVYAVSSSQPGYDPTWGGIRVEDRSGALVANPTQLDNDCFSPELGQIEWRSETDFQLTFWVGALCP